MRLNLIVALFFGLLQNFVAAGQQNWQWAVADGSSHRYEYTRGMVKTADGGVLVLGLRNAGRTPQFFFGAQDVIVTKFDSTGTIVWRRIIGNQDSYNLPCSVATAPSGDVYVLIGFSGVVNLGSAGRFASSSQSVPGIQDGLLIKLSASGVVQWGKQMVGNPSSTWRNILPKQVLVDAAGRVWVAGNFDSSITIDNFFLLGTGSIAFFLARFDAAGNTDNVIAGGGITEIGRLAADAQGYLYVAGSLSGRVDFGPFRVRAPRKGFFVAKYDSQLQAHWVRMSDTTAIGTMELRGFARDAQGDYVVAGKMEGMNRFGATTFVTPPANQNDLFVARYDSSGAVRWARQATGPSPERIHALAVDEGGNTYLGGGYFGAFHLAGTAMPPDSTNFIASIDAGGNVGWAMPVGSSAAAYTWYWNDATVDLTPGPNHSLYVAGCFARTATFGSTSLTSQGADDYYVARLVNARPLGLAGEREVEQAVALYPNPASAPTGCTLQLARPMPTTGSVQVCSMVGQVVFRAELPQGTQQLALQPERLPKGIYSVQVDLGSAKVRRKLVVE